MEPNQYDLSKVFWQLPRGAKQQKYQFWETQPVPKIDEEPIKSEPIEPNKPVEEIRKEPYNLPEGFIWDNIDLTDDNILRELYTLLNENYVEDDDSMFRFDYSPKFLRWALQPPGWRLEWHCGVRVTKTNKLVGFIGATPAQIKIQSGESCEQVKMVEINFLCVHKRLRSKRMTPVLIREITRRVNLAGIFQAIFTAGVVIPKPIAQCRYWHRSLNVKKLIDVKFSSLTKNMTLKRTLRLYNLPETTRLEGFKEMEKSHIPQIFDMMTEYLKKFDLTPQFSMEEIEHWFLPQEEVINSYVVERDGKILAFASFYTLPSTVISHPTYDSIKAAYSFYNYATKPITLVELIRDVLIVAKQLDYDVFNALDLMENKKFLEELKFGIGDGDLQYYLYNWKCPTYQPEQAVRPCRPKLGSKILSSKSEEPKSSSGRAYWRMIMKYKQLLHTNMVPEWRNQYLDYDGLDAALNKAIESKNMKARRKGVDLYFELIKFNQKFANYFSRECQEQLDKINAFHKEKLNEMKGKFNNLHDQLDQVLSSAIYREIQPNLEHYNDPNHQPQASSTCENEFANNSTISSVSELFRNLRGKLNSTTHATELTPEAIRCSQTVHHSKQQDRHPALTNLFPRSSQRPSVTPMMGGRDRAGSPPPPSERRESKSLKLHFNRDKMTVMKRKLSESFLSSAQKISNNLANLQNTFNTYGHQNEAPLASSLDSYQHYIDPVAQKTNNDYRSPRLAGAGAARMDSPGGRRLSRKRIQDMNQNFHTLAGANPLSRSKIVASYKKKLSNLKFAFRELYFNLVLFEQYTQLNYNGFQQILRKHDRMFASSLGRKFYEEHVQTADFYNDLQAIDHLIENVEHIYTLHFENGNRRRAIEKLQVPANVYKPSTPKLDFRVGYEFGMFSILFILVVLVGLVSETGYDWRTVFRLYRSPLVLIIFLFQTGISIVIWKHYKINHVLIFELNPRDNLSFQHFIEFGSILGIIWSISVLLFLFSSKFDIKPSILPLIVVLIVTIYVFNPTKTCHYRARFWLIKRLGRIFISPFSGRVRFADFWLADQLVSIVPLFLDLEYLFCFYTTGDVLSNSHLTPYYANRCVTRNPQDLVIRTIVAALPAWFRCAQCLRRWRDENWLTMHLANAGKYWCMVTVVVLSSASQYNKSSFELDPMRIVWMVAAIFTSSLTAYWDIIYDFGLFNKYDKDEQHDAHSGNRSPSSSISSAFDTDELHIGTKKNDNKQYPFLRKELVYPVWVYYFAIVENIILRFGWIITISLTEFSGIEAGLVVSLLAPMEMFRRFVWNCIRLENEQLNNCGLFRAVRDIPMEVVAPIDESHLDKVIMMMDSRDGPSMRNRLMKRRTLRPDRVSFMILQRPGTAETITRRCNVRS